MTESQGLKRQDYISQIWSLCTTMSTEAIDAAETRAQSNNFNVDRGEITFTEIGINLASARETLMDAIEKKKLIQLPITVQKDLLADLQGIGSALKGIMNNSDEIINLGAAVEALNTSIWKFGLHNLSDQVLGYQIKLNQLKQQDIQAKKLLAILGESKNLATSVSALAERLQSDNVQSEKSRTMIEQDAAAVTTLRQTTESELTKITEALNLAKQSETQAAKHQSSAKASLTDIESIQTSIKSFYSEVDTNRQLMTDSIEESKKFLIESGASLTAEIEKTTKSAGELTTRLDKAEIDRAKSSQETIDSLQGALKERSEQTIEKNNADTAKLIQELAVLKESVKEQIAQATGLGQFGAFQSRQNTISKTKYVWVAAIALLVGAVIALTYFIAVHAQTSDLHSAAFWIKISMNVPLGFLITFCTIQYSRERRLEEEYAFKASISVSLNPYRELIYSILEKEGGLKDGTYTAFVVDSVRNVFTSPTEKIYESTKGITEKSLKAAAELLGTVVKAAK